MNVPIDVTPYICRAVGSLHTAGVGGSKPLLPTKVFKDLRGFLETGKFTASRLLTRQLKVAIVTPIPTAYLA